MKDGGEAASCDKDRRTAGVVRADPGMGERESQSRYAYGSQGDHQGQVKAAAV
jgi:hypothetical protein